MKTLKCEYCGNIIKPGCGGLKYINLYFCSQECLNEHINWDTYPIEPSDFERDGEDEEDDEIVNDYDIQMGYAND